MVEPAPKPARRRSSRLQTGHLRPFVHCVQTAVHGPQIPRTSLTHTRLTTLSPAWSASQPSPARRWTLASPNEGRSRHRQFRSSRIGPGPSAPATFRPTHTSHFIVTHTSDYTPSGTSPLILRRRRTTFAPPTFPHPRPQQLFLCHARAIIFGGSRRSILISQLFLSLFFPTSLFFLPSSSCSNPESSPALSFTLFLPTTRYSHRTE